MSELNANIETDLTKKVEEIELSGESDSEPEENELENDKKRKCSEIESGENKLPEKKITRLFDEEDMKRVLLQVRKEREDAISKRVWLLNYMRN